MSRRDDYALLVELQVKLGCASPGDVLVVCRRRSLCPPTTCADCVRVRVTAGLTPTDVIARLGRLEPRPPATIFPQTLRPS